MFSFFSEWSAAQRLAEKKFHVIFFAESRYYFQYFRHLFDALTACPGICVAYITSDKGDEILSDKRAETFYLKSTLAGAFPRLQADVMIMTVPDLQNFIFKKSASVKKYVYVFHAMVSTHQQYRSHAFDHYDAVFCTGPQQEAEIWESETLYSLPPKDVVRYGYPLLEELKEKAAQTSTQEKKILIAPSWYTAGILNTCILPLVGRLVLKRYPVWIRPHPEFVKRNKKAYERLVEAIAPCHTVHLDHSASVFTHLLDAAFLITDRSGIALEYAFAVRRPVLFIDTPLKIQNTDVSKFSAQPLENQYRKFLGEAIRPDEIENVGEVLEKLESTSASYLPSIQKTETEVVFGKENWRNGIAYILGCLKTN